jgi:hypothetical protein
MWANMQDLLGAVQESKKTVDEKWIKTQTEISTSGLTFITQNNCGST